MTKKMTRKTINLVIKKMRAQNPISLGDLARVVTKKTTNPPIKKMKRKTKAQK